MNVAIPTGIKLFCYRGTKDCPMSKFSNERRRVELTDFCEKRF